MLSAEEVRNIRKLIEMKANKEMYEKYKEEIEQLKDTISDSIENAVKRRRDSCVIDLLNLFNHNDRLLVVYWLIDFLEAKGYTTKIIESHGCVSPNYSIKISWKG